MQPKVSVVVVTYNHVTFIDEALDSVFGQEADFDFEVIISEDASTDGTREKLLSWRDRFPARTRLLLSDKNLCSNETIRRGFHAAKGDYVALLDGDDAWISRRKLAAQVAVLDADRSLSLCIHNARVSEGTTRFGDLWTDPNLKRRFHLSDLWEGNPFPTCGTLFRRASLPHIPEWYSRVSPMVTDWPLYVLFAERGDIAFLPEVWGMYRLHAGGQYSPRTERHKFETTDRLYRCLNEGTEYRHDGPLRRGRQRFFLDFARHYLNLGEVDLARDCLRRARTYRPSRSLTGLVETLQLELQSRLMQESAM